MERPAIIFLLVAVVTTTSSSAVVVKSDALDALDYRSVSYEDLLPGLEQFFDDGVGHFDQLLFDSPHHQLVVGARDALYRLSLEGLTKLEKAEWPAKTDKIVSCTNKGQKEADCRNFVKVLASYRDQLLACGTYAFSPKCSWRPIEAINQVTQWVDGRGKCPYSPRANSSAFMNAQGDYYIASSTDFSANDHAIYKMSSWPMLDQGLLRTEMYNTMMLSQTSFVLTFETDRFVYFVFRENAIEYMNCGKTIYSRIARVCKNDKGGRRVSTNNWTTFLKARLNCSDSGDYPFYYNEIQSAYYLASEGLVYATFTTPENSIAGSAICSFNLSSIEDTFEGPFKKQSGPDSTWKAVHDVDHSHFECGGASESDYSTPTSRDYQLMDKAVPSSLEGPIYKEHLERFTHILVDSALTKHQDTQPVHVLFLATREGLVKKLSYNPRSRVTCLVEVLHPFAEGRAVVIHNMKMAPFTSAAIYMATEENVIRLPVQRCQRFRTQRACLNAMDPYCGWNQQTNECAATPNNNPRASYWQQSLISCPILSDPVDGGYGSWSAWFQCDYANPDKRVDSNGDYCQCRQRKCDSPAPANGGLECGGRSLEVTNCTQHGGWTEWSDWSACSQSCDIGMKQRRRTCGNPAPAFGGRVCVGRDVDSQYCNDLPSCSKAVSVITPSASLVRETSKGLWGQWAAWSDCSADCGRGFRTRSRKCFSSQGLCEGGCATQFEECENKKCSDLVEVTDWTPWLKSNESLGGSWHEQRFRFAYKAPVSISQVGQIHMEERYCRGINSCITTAATSQRSQNMDSWSQWSQCSRECGGGYQVKIRTCDQGRNCVGGSVVQRACNTQPCTGEWACWADWSTCDGRSLKKHRTRHCQSINGIVNGDRTSPLCSTGTSYEEVPCDGWGPWSSWSQCDLATDTRTRSRVCLTSVCDEGHDHERQSCDGLPAQPVSSSSDLLAVACICSFVVGGGLGAGLVLYFLKFRRPGGNGSPHYVSAKSQNLYVSLPMLDLKHKHLSSNQSDCGTLRSTSTLRSKAGSSVYNNTTRSDYETATIKRSHSHSQRNSSLIAGGSSTLMRADLDSDQLFH